MQTLPITAYLLKVARYVENEWSFREAIDWDEAEDLHGLIKEFVETNKIEDASLNQIISYGDDVEDWDSGVVAQWPELIIKYLETQITD